jgi:hypothetical protein
MALRSCRADRHGRRDHRGRCIRTLGGAALGLGVVSFRRLAVATPLIAPPPDRRSAPPPPLPPSSRHRVRNRLSAGGGKRIRTFGPALVKGLPAAVEHPPMSPCRQIASYGRAAMPCAPPSLHRDRWFESGSLQRGVQCEPTFIRIDRRQAIAGDVPSPGMQWRAVACCRPGNGRQRPPSTERGVERIPAFSALSSRPPVDSNSVTSGLVEFDPVLRAPLPQSRFLGLV